MAGDDVSMFENCGNVVLIEMWVKPLLSRGSLKSTWWHVTNNEDLRKNSEYN